MIKPPTDRQLMAWWDTQPEGEYTCADCGRTDSKAYVQPQHPYFMAGAAGVALCARCIGVRQRVAQARRREELANRPPDCQRCGRKPHTWRVAGFKLCGRCRTHVIQEQRDVIAEAGALGIIAACSGQLFSTKGWAHP